MFSVVLFLLCENYVCALLFVPLMSNFKTMLRLMLLVPLMLKIFFCLCFLFQTCLCCSCAYFYVKSIFFSHIRPPGLAPPPPPPPPPQLRSTTCPTPPPPSPARPQSSAVAVVVVGMQTQTKCPVLARIAICPVAEKERSQTQTLQISARRIPTTTSPKSIHRHIYQTGRRSWCFYLCPLAYVFFAYAVL